MIDRLIDDFLIKYNNIDCLDYTKYNNRINIRFYNAGYPSSHFKDICNIFYSKLFSNGFRSYTKYDFYYNEDNIIQEFYDFIIKCR